MLLRVSASNCLSIAERQELSLVSTKLKGPNLQTFAAAGAGGLRALPAAVIYGANASGKSNFVKAFQFMRRAILDSHSKGSPEGGVPRIHFGLDDNATKKPTVLEADFIVDEIRFQYGFECNDDEFLTEWLYSFPEGKRRKLFERKGASVEFGQYFKGAKRTLVDFMRKNSLFISTATQNDHEELSRIVSFFRSIKFSNNVAVGEFMLKNVFRKDQIDTRTIKFLESIGTGVVRHRQNEFEMPESVKSFSSELRNLLKKNFSGLDLEETIADQDKVVSIELAHAGTDGKEYYFELEHESAGTRRLILIMNMVFRAIDEGSVVVVDELDASLHTLASEQILEIFASCNLNQNGAQLIATTHDTNLLGSRFLRRDQVWFCEKNDAGASEIYPLSDIKTRRSDNFEAGYLEGRFGAIPFSGDFRAILRGS